MLLYKGSSTAAVQYKRATWPAHVASARLVACLRSFGDRLRTEMSDAAPSTPPKAKANGEAQGTSPVGPKSNGAVPKGEPKPTGTEPAEPPQAAATPDPATDCHDSSPPSEQPAAIDRARSTPSVARPERVADISVPAEAVRSPAPAPTKEHSSITGNEAKTQDQPVLLQAVGTGGGSRPIQD